jgi:hypothetical protein
MDQRDAGARLIATAPEKRTSSRAGELAVERQAQTNK